MTSDSPLYLYYTTRLVAFEDFSCLDLYFRSDIGLPEDTFMRITEIDGQAGNFGEGRPKATSEYNIGPENLLVSRIISTALPDEISSLTVLCIDPATNETIATLILGDKRGDLLQPRKYTPAPTSTVQPEPAATLVPDTVLENLSLGIAEKPKKYSHYNAWLRIYPNHFELCPRFRYHDPLPEGTVLRVISIDGVPGNYGEALIGPANLDNANPNLLSAQIELDLPINSTQYTVAAFAPGSEEAIFTVILTNSHSGTSYWSGGNWYAPGGDVYYPTVWPTPTPYNFGLYYNPAPTSYHPFYNYDNWNNWYGNPTNNFGDSFTW